MKKWMLIPIALLLAAAFGAAAHFRAEAVRSRTGLADALREIERLRAAAPAAPAAPVPGTASSSDPDALLAQIRELEQLLQEPEADRPAGSPAAGAAQAGPEAAAPSRRNWMEELKKTDPARYEEMVQRRDQARQEMLAARAEQSDFFLKRAEESPSAEDQAHYQQMTQLLDSTWQMMDLLRSELPEEQRRELRSAIRDNLRTLSPLLAAERNKEFRRLGLELGATEAESQAVADRINQVLRVTNARDLLRHRPGGGGGFGGRPEPGRDR